MTIKAKKSKINLREKLAELLNFRQIRDRLDGLGLYLGKDRTGTSENVAVRGGANVDDLQLAEISAALGGTAVDVFVYDTRNDSDGGKWRERTSHTSWYNEELNTATRGGRREFPAVAVIVAEADKVTIYDGDDPDLSMWMVFEDNSTTGFIGWGSTVICVNEAVSALNAQLVYGGANGLGGGIINFAKDDMRCVYDNPWTVELRTIVDRNETTTIISGGDGIVIVNNKINDVAMTVLPNAPIDSDTGLPIPTIAVATDGGVSVIRDDGSVVDIVYTNQTIESLWLKQNRIWIAPGNGGLIVGDIPDTDKSSGTASGLSSSINGWNAFTNTNETLSTLGSTNTLTHGETFGSDQGLNLIYEEKSNPASSLVAYTTSTYNTGWMPGDTKLATLSDTKNEKVGVDESELVSNGTFDSNTNDWSSTNSSTLSVDNQRLKIQGVGSSYPNAYISVNVVEGVEYEVSAEYISNSNSFSGRIRVSSSSPLGGDIVNGTIKSAGTTHVNRFTASSTGSVYVALMLQDSGGNSSGIWDNVSVKQTGELITNGTFDDGTTGWTETSNPTLTVTNGKLNLKCLSGDNQAGIHQNFLADDPNRKYTLSFDIDSFTGDTAANLVVGVDNYWNNSSLGTTQLFSGKENGSYSFTFNGRSGAMSILFRVFDTTGSCSEDTSINIDNISVRLAEDDRSVNNNGLQIFGQIDKTPVAPGADLVAYSGFSADDYLMQPYNGDLDFGTGDFCVMGWIKPTASNEIFLEARSETEGRSFAIQQYSSKYYFYVGNEAFIESPTYTDENIWTNLAFIRKNGIAYIYRNGILVSSDLRASSVDRYNTKLFVGYCPLVGTAHLDGSMALWRVSATAPTAEQIAKIYRDEKALFTDGAQATLYGTSDAVTALAYDDKTELLHVGTSSGRSDFAGLRRINNTTTAVTTSISASNNLIAEQ